ncbi:MAG: ABC transporter ATP-binding protein [Planctomycetota bacterium]
MFEFSDLKKSFGRARAVRGVSAALGPGRPTGLLGPNGAGKTTTIRMLVGILEPDAGTVHLAGQRLCSSDPAPRRKIGYLPESAPLYPELTPPAFLRYRARLYGIAARDRRRRIGEAIENCGLASVRSKRIGTLSKGFRQRVGLAGAILHDPPVLVLDEPATGLDPVQNQSLRDLVRGLARERVVLFSSHTLQDVERTCDRILIMSEGRFIADGPPATVGADAVPGAWHVRCSSDPAPLIGALTGHARVASARALDREPHRLRVTPMDGAEDLGQIIATEASKAGLLVTELAAEDSSLEQRFAAVLRADAERGDR